MSKHGILLVVGLVVAATSISAQSHPDFAGNWMLVHRDVADGEPAGVFGEVFVATQSSTSLIFDWRFLGPSGRGSSGKLVYRTVHSAFPFDGAESNVTEIVSTGSRQQIVDTSVWDGGKLIVTTTWRGNVRTYVSRKRTLSLEPDGILIVETSTPPAQAGEPWLAVQSRYRRFGLGNER